jgi:type I restriction enzyme S subunit
VAFSLKTIGDVTQTLIDYRGKTPKKAPSGIKLITAKVIKGGTILNGRHEYIAEDTYDAWMRRGLPRLGDILITTEAPLGEVAQLKASEKVALAQRVILLRGNPEIIDQQFYFQALKSSFVQDRLRARATGTTVLGIKQSELRQIQLPYFPLSTQRKIASVLSAYDDLIDNNTRRIEILEEMAQRIYREWFINFRFPGYERVEMVNSPLGLIPEGWKVKPVGELLSYHIGGGWGKEDRSDEFQASAYVIRGTDIPLARRVSTDSCPLRFHKKSNLTSRQLRVEDIVFEVSGGSKGQPVGRSLLVGEHLLRTFDEDVMCASFCKLLRVDRKVMLPQLLFSHFLQIYHNGQIEKYQVQPTGISNFKFKFFLESELVLVPDLEMQIRFDEMTTPLLRAIGALGAKNTNLRHTRDLLLPKLISGEVSVENLDVGPEEVSEAEFVK